MDFAYLLYSPRFRFCFEQTLDSVRVVRVLGQMCECVTWALTCEKMKVPHVTIGLCKQTGPCLLDFCF